MSRQALYYLQKNFQHYLLNDANVMEDFVEEPVQGTIQQRLGIYSESYKYRLIELLETDYFGVKAMLGEEDFREMASLYVNNHTSNHFTPRNFGRDMPAFLERTKPYSEQTSLKDMANYEWALIHTIDAADASILSMADLSTIPQGNWHRMVFKPHPSLQLIEFNWNIPPLFQAISEKTKLPKLNKFKNPALWTVWRQGIETRFSSNEEGANATAIKNICEGKSFGDMCEDLLDWIPEAEVAQYAVNLLVSWIKSEWFTSVRIV